MKTTLLPLSCAVLSLCAAAQSGRTTMLTAPVVLGQTAGFALGHSPSIAGNVYALLLSAPSWPQAVPVTLPGMVVNGLLRLDVNGLLVGAAGVLDVSGRSPIVPMPVPNNPLLVGFSFDVQGVDRCRGCVHTGGQRRRDRGSGAAAGEREPGGDCGGDVPDGVERCYGSSSLLRPGGVKACARGDDHAAVLDGEV
jgi:hypothetical protein